VNDLGLVIKLKKEIEELKHNNNILEDAVKTAENKTNEIYWEYVKLCDKIRDENICFRATEASVPEL
jgi:FtsZ-binding cell division protein ZapB